MAKILLFGAGGQFGREFLNLYENIIPVFHSNNSEGLNADLNDFDSIKRIINEYKPDIIVNGAAFNNVDLSEKEHGMAYNINSLAVKTMAQEASRIKAKLVHISTDYIFDGVDGNYNEKSIPNPINFYGLSKLIGENFAAAYETPIIVRTSGVFGYSNNYPLFVYNNLKDNKKVNAINGFYSPIHAYNLARAIKQLIDLNYNGIINLAGERISRYDLAIKIAETFNFDKNIEEIENSNNMLAKRPYDSSLDISMAKKMLGFDFYSIKSNLERLKNNISL
jgi:dTDP-4-dehydrorhamnose reductase